MRRLATVAGFAAAMLATPTPALAHGLGVRGDLPLPLWVVSYGAIAVLAVSFVALVKLWPRPRFEGSTAGALLPPALSRTVAWVEWPARVVGLVGLALVLAVAVAGPETTDQSLVPFAVYVVVWVGGMLVSGFVGDLWRALNPMETAGRLLVPLSDTPPPWLERAGTYPAALLLLAFAWLELVHPYGADPRVLGIAIVVYVGVIVLGAAWWGRSWVRAADAFGVFFSILAAMAPLHRDAEGRLRLRPPLVGLAQLEPRRGTAAVVLVALGSTTFDGLERTDLWEDVVGNASPWGGVPVNTVGLLATIVVVSLLYVGAIRHATQEGGGRTAHVSEQFAHSLVPIALAYAIAHYFSLFVFEGQRFIALLSDPFANGWNLFGTADWSINFTAVSAMTIGIVQVAAILLGHVAGIVLAHDRAVALYPPETASRTQHGLLVAMVAYTVGALLLLLGA